MRLPRSVGGHMKITTHPILSEADYDAALDEIAELMDAAPNTRGGARLDVLVTMVEAYEARHWVIPTPEDGAQPR